MASRARKIIDEKIESLKLLTGNQDLVVKYSGGKFNGDVWFNSYATSMKNLRIELLTLYLNELKNDRLA